MREGGRLYLQDFLEPLDKITVALYSEPLDDRASDYGADAGRSGKLFLARFRRAIERPEILREQYRRLFSHMRNGKPNQKSRQFNGATSLDRSYEFLCGDFGKTFERQKISFGKREQLVIMLDQSFFEQLIDGSGPESIYVECVFPDKVVEAPPHNRERVLVHAPPRRLPGNALYRAIISALRNALRPEIRL